MTFVNPFRKTLCPVCFERFYLGDCQIVSTTSPGTVVEDRPLGLKHVWQRLWIKQLSGPRYTTDLACRACPYCGYELPHNIEYMANWIVGMVGGTYSSKSHYICSLIKQIERDGALDGVGCTEFKPLNEKTRNKYVRDYYNPLFIDKQTITKNAPVMPGTFIEPLIYVMVFRSRSGFSRIKRVNLILFDAAGEDMSDEVAVAQISRYILNASGLIFLVDPQTIPGVYAQLPYHLRGNVGPEGFRVLDAVIDILRRQRGVLPGSDLPIPIAITLAKSDLLKYVLGIQSNQPVFLSDPNYGDAYSTEDLKAVHDEIKEIIRRHDGAALVRSSEAFAEATFCAVSATGCSPDAQGNFPVVEPIRCADPLLWILAQLGVIEA